MDAELKAVISREVKREPFAQALKMELVDLEAGLSAVEMDYDPSVMEGNLRHQGKGISRVG